MCKVPNLPQYTRPAQRGNSHCGHGDPVHTHHLTLYKGETAEGVNHAPYLQYLRMYSSSTSGQAALAGPCSLHPSPSQHKAAEELQLSTMPSALHKQLKRKSEAGAAGPLALDEGPMKR
jgi:hypothetical protein